MSTKTLPKKPASIDALMVTQIFVSDVDAEELADACGIEPGDDGYSQKITALRCEVNAALSLHAHELKHVQYIPMPAHIQASLEPIARHAKLLSELLHEDRLPKELAVGLSNLKTMRWELDTLIYDAENELLTLHNEPSTGQHVAVRAGRLQAAENVLKKVFDNQTVSDYRGDATAQKADQNDFVRICKRYLPG